MWLGSFEEKLERTLLVCRNEWGPLLWMGLLNFFIGAGATLGFCVGNAIFMSAIYRQKFGLHVFPLAFIIAAGLLIPYFAFYNQIERKKDRKFILVVSLLAYAAIVSLFGYMLGLNPTDYYLILTVFVFATCILLILNLQFWSFANHIFHPRQGKRLFPLLGMGGIIGASAMGFSLKFLVAALNGTNKLLYIWGIILAMSSLLVLLMYRFLPIREVKKEQAKDFISALVQDFKIIDRFPLLRIMAAIIFIMSSASFIIYFKFNGEVGARFPGEADFAAFVGDFNGILYLTVFFYQLLLTGRLVSGLGLINSMFLYPAMLLLPVFGIVAYPASYVPILSCRFVDELFAKTIFETTSESIYGSVPDANREQAMSFMQIIVTPLSIGFSGLIMVILFKSFQKAVPLATTLALPLLLVLWGFFIWKLKDLYIDTLFGNFVSGDDQNRLESFRALTQLKGARTQELLKRTLELGSEKMKLFAMELAGEMKMANLKHEIFQYVTSEDSHLRSQAVISLGKIGGGDLYPRLMRVYKDQPTPIKMLILDNLQNIDPWNFSINAPLLVSEEKDPIIQVYLLEYIWGKNELLTEQREVLKGLLKSENHRIREAAAQCLRWDKDRSFEKDLMALLNDEDHTVLRKAVISAGEMRAATAVKRLLELLESDEAALAEDALKALVKIRVDVAQEVIKSLTLQESPDVLTRKLKLIAHTGDAGQHDFLFHQVDKVIPEAVAPALEVVARNLHDFRTFSRQEIATINSFINNKVIQIRNEFKAAYVLRKKFKDYMDPGIILLMLLKERIDTLRRIILLGLHLLHPQEKILTVMENIFSGDSRKKNIAVEALENLLPIDYKRFIIPLFEKDDLVEEMEYIVDIYHLSSEDYDRMLEIISRTGDNWMKAWAFFTAGVLKLQSWKPLMEEATRSDDRLLSEHALVGIRLLENGKEPDKPPEEEDKKESTG